MNPQPPSNESAQYPRDPMGGVPSGPFQGDKIYVAIDAILTLAGFAIMFGMAPAIAQESIKQQATSGGPKADPAMVQNIMYGMFGCMFLVCMPITIAIWIFMIKGKNWAFIVGIVLGFLGLLNGIYTVVTGPVLMLGLFGLITSIARVGYLGGRIMGKIGPKPG